MIQQTKEVINFIESGGIIHCDTLEKAQFLCKFLNKHGYKWSSGEGYTPSKWETFKEGTCYVPKKGLYSTIDYYKTVEYDNIKNVSKLFRELRLDIYLSKSTINSILCPTYPGTSKEVITLSNIF